MFFVSFVFFVFFVVEEDLLFFYAPQADPDDPESGLASWTICFAN